MLYSNDQRLGMFAHFKHYALFALAWAAAIASAVIGGIYGIKIGRSFATTVETVASGTLWSTMALGFAIGFCTSCLQTRVTNVTFTLKLGKWSMPHVSLQFACLFAQLQGVILVALTAPSIYFLNTGQLL